MTEAEARQCGVNSYLMVDHPSPSSGDFDLYRPFSLSLVCVNILKCGLRIWPLIFHLTDMLIMKQIGF